MASKMDQDHLSGQWLGSFLAKSSARLSPRRTLIREYGGLEAPLPAARPLLSRQGPTTPRFRRRDAPSTSEPFS